MKNYINHIRELVFGEQFRIFLKEAYDKGVLSGEFSECEREYVAACSWFEDNWSEEKKEILCRVTDMQIEKRNYAGEYAFCCGISVAFEQFFTEKKELRYDFSECLDRGLYELEGMKGHPYYYRVACEVRKAFDSLFGDEKELTQEDGEELITVENNPEQYHLTSHECGWEQRIHSGAIGAYYLGYRLALEVIERVCPLATQYMMNQILMVEYELGITLPAAERERLKGKIESESQPEMN